VVDDPTRTRQVQPLRSEPRRALLEIRVADQPARRVVIEREVVVIGRSRDTDLQLDMEGVSRKHARISKTGDRSYNLVDLGAKNGTYLNGERIDVAVLHHGDRIQIGTAELTMSFDDVDLGAHATAPDPAALQATLSPREWEVARAVAEGLTNAEIAARLGITKRTVATHLERIFERLELHSRAALAHRVALQLGPRPADRSRG
jgi:DNA-binding CsgD family transcriptional regulator